MSDSVVLRRYLALHARVFAATFANACELLAGGARIVEIADAPAGGEALRGRLAASRILRGQGTDFFCSRLRSASLRACHDGGLEALGRPTVWRGTGV